MLPNIKINLTKIPKENRYGAVRKHDIHTGIDIFCLPHSVVEAYEDGTVVNVCTFTGASVGSPWWRETSAVLVEGESGVILYGELEPYSKIGDVVTKGDSIGAVMQVLKRDKGNPMTMLHIELYEKGYRGDGEVWTEVEKKPPMLLNVEELFKTKLRRIYEKLRDKMGLYSI